MALSSLIILSLLGIQSTLGEADYKSPFSQEIKLQYGKTPFKLGNELKLLERSSAIVSIGPGYEKCKLTGKFFPKWISHFGNGKLLMIGDTVTDFNVVDFKSCSSQVNTLISNGTKAPHDRRYDDKLKSLVTYDDTFDVFDHYQRTCMPCRYNDKGERLQVEHSLEKEPTGQDPEYAHQHDGYSLELVKDAFGVKNGYFYVFRYVNGTTALKILDSKFKLVKQRLFNAKIEAHSVLQENITVCYKVNACRRPYRGWCQSVKCHLLDSNLNSTAEVELHNVNTAPRDNKIAVEMNVRNLIGGGAMVALKFHFDQSQPVHRKDIFLQRIHPNGRVDEAIQFDSVDNDFTYMHDFTFDNGEYCLVTVNDHYRKGSYTLVKCLYPSSNDGM